MAKDGLIALACALASALAPVAIAGDDPAIASTLAVQTALQQGRDLLLKGHNQAAVHVLEGQLSKINGHREYLAVLRDAYRALVKELRLANQEAAAQVYLQRLLILDPGATLDFGQRTAGAVVPPPAKPAEKPAPTVRLQKDENPFSEFQARQGRAKELVDQAEREFAGRRYTEAARLYEQAHQSDQGSTTAGRERWGYCKLHQVVQQLNEPSASGVAAAELEKEVKLALSLAPKLDSFGQDVLRRIAEQRSGQASTPAVAVKHAGRTKEGWDVAETTNFRLFHQQQSREYVERAAEIAERTRTEMHRKWLGEAGLTWSPRCDIYLHATGQDYSRATSVPATSPGHSTMRTEGSRVLERRIDLHCDDTNLLTAVLPHETTHVVLAGKFGEHPVPRWVDEGVAVLSEPRDKIERHLRILPQLRQDKQLFTTRQLMQLNDYPDPRHISSFYAQSVSLVEFLSAEKGPESFTRFIRDGLKTGYEAALKRHYGYQDFNELEQHWRRFAFKEGTAITGVAGRGR